MDSHTTMTHQVKDVDVPAVAIFETTQSGPQFRLRQQYSILRLQWKSTKKPLAAGLLANQPQKQHEPRREHNRLSLHSILDLLLLLELQDLQSGSWFQLLQQLHRWGLTARLCSMQQQHLLRRRKHKHSQREYLFHHRRRSHS